MVLMNKLAENNWPLEVCIAARIVHLKCIINTPDYRWNWNSGAKFFNKYTGQHVPDGLFIRRMLLKNTGPNQDYCASQCPLRHDLIIDFEKEEWIAQKPYGDRGRSDSKTTNLRFYPRHRDTDEYKTFAAELKSHLTETGNGSSPVEPQLPPTFGPPNTFHAALGWSKVAQENRQFNMGGR